MRAPLISKGNAAPFSIASQRRYGNIAGGVDCARNDYLVAALSERIKASVKGGLISFTAIIEEGLTQAGNYFN